LVWKGGLSCTYQVAEGRTRGFKKLVGNGYRGGKEGQTRVQCHASKGVVLIRHRLAVEN
jgi:hypothetical protein